MRRQAALRCWLTKSAAQLQSALTCSLQSNSHAKLVCFGWPLAHSWRLHIDFAEGVRLSIEQTRVGTSLSFLAPHRQWDKAGELRLFSRMHLCPCLSLCACMSIHARERRHLCVHVCLSIHLHVAIPLASLIRLSWAGTGVCDRHPVHGSPVLQATAAQQWPSRCAQAPFTSPVQAQLCQLLRLLAQPRRPFPAPSAAAEPGL